MGKTDLVARVPGDLLEEVHARTRRAELWARRAGAGAAAVGYLLYVLGGGLTGRITGSVGPLAFLGGGILLLGVVAGGATRPLVALLLGAGGRRRFAERVRVKEAWSRRVTLHGAPGLVVAASFRILPEGALEGGESDQETGARHDITLRVRFVDERRRRVGALLDAYRDQDGHAFAQQVLRGVPEGGDNEAAVGVFLPLRAFDLEPGSVTEVRAELELLRGPHEDALHEIGVTLEGPPVAEPAALPAGTGEGACQVCGDALADPVVRCRICETLHHEDCWEYLRGCSTFACPSERAAP